MNFDRRHLNTHFPSIMEIGLENIVDTTEASDRVIKEHDSVLPY